MLKDAHEDRLGMMSRRLLVWRARQVLRSDAVWSMKGFALTLLATQGELAREARDEVLAMMSDAAPSNRGWAATVLACAGIDDDETRAALLVMVREDPHVEARYRAMDALRYLDPSAEIVPVLLEVFRAAERDVRGYAARELVKIGPEGIRPLSRELLVAHQRRREVIDALRNADAPNADAAVDAIAAALRSPEWEIRRDAAELAGDMPLGPDAAPVFTALVAALGDEHPDVLRAARRSLDTVDPVAEPMLIEALTNPRPEIVEAVCTILPRRRPVPAAALPALAEVAADEGLPDSVREAARQAVARIEWLRERSAERE